VRPVPRRADAGIVERGGRHAYIRRFVGSRVMPVRNEAVNCASNGLPQGSARYWPSILKAQFGVSRHSVLQRKKHRKSSRVPLADCITPYEQTQEASNRRQDSDRQTWTNTNAKPTGPEEGA
jgi:hypothetical protein